MRLRAVQLACLVLLLSSLSAAHGTTLRSGDLGLGSSYIGALLAHDQTATAHNIRNTPRTADADAAISTAAFTVLRAPRSMRPAAAHVAALYARTSAA